MLPYLRVCLLTNDFASHHGAGDQSQLLEHATGAVGMPMMSLQKTLFLLFLVSDAEI